MKPNSDTSEIDVSRFIYSCIFALSLTHMETEPNIGIQRYSAIQRDTARYSAIQRDTAIMSSAIQRYSDIADTIWYMRYTAIHMYHQSPHPSQ